MKRWKIACVIAIIGIGSYMGLSGHTKASNSSTLTLRVAFPYAKPAREYEPTRISLAPQYIFLETVFSPLVEFAPVGGEVIPGIAEKMEWKGDALYLHIRRGLKTVSGYEITAKDAEFSLKRVLVLTGNTHGNFRDLVCGAGAIKKITDECDGIRVDGNSLILKTKGNKSFLLPMLTAMDFAVIPERSVDPKTLKIIDYENTSGPYYVSHDSETGEIELTANPTHYHYSKKLAQIVKLVPTGHADPMASLKAFKEGRVDLITTIDAAKPESVIDLKKELSDSTLHTTMNIRSYVLVFTERGIRELTPERRLSIGKAIRQSFVDGFQGVSGYETSTQFFPAFGEGGLTKEMLAKLDAHYKENGPRETGKGLKLTTIRIGDPSKYATMIHRHLPDLQVSEATDSPDFLGEKNSQMPQMYIAGPDTGFQEDIGLISYSLNAGYFGMTKPEKSKWLAEYMAIEDKEERLKRLRDLHYKTLIEPVMVPLLVGPYVALAKSNWKIELSQLYANDPIWQIRAQ